MAGERSDLVNVPARARKVGQAEMTQCMRAEALDNRARRASSRTTFDQLQIEIGWV